MSLLLAKLSSTRVVMSQSERGKGTQVVVSQVQTSQQTKPTVTSHMSQHTSHVTHHITRVYSIISLQNLMKKSKVQSSIA